MINTSSFLRSFLLAAVSLCFCHHAKASNDSRHYPSIIYCTTNLQDDSVKNKLMILVRFTVPVEDMAKFNVALTELFNHIRKEKAFHAANLIHPVDQPGIVVLYEEWNMDQATFLKEQATRSYRLPFDKIMADLKVEREVKILETH